jgi:hypothetical protein
VVWVVWWVRGGPIGAVSPAGGESWLAASVPKLVGWQGQGQGRRGEGGKSRAGRQARRTCSRLQTGGQRRRAPLYLPAGVAATAAAAESEAMHSAHRRGVAARRRPP